MTEPMKFAFPGSVELGDGWDASKRSKLESKEAALRAKVSPPGALGLPPLLEARRLDFGITDWAFAAQPAYDRVFVHQVRRPEETFGGGTIIKADITKAKEEKQCPMGIIVGAGALALDSLRANGMDLGHLVMFLRLVPYRIETDFAGTQQSVMVLRTGDIVGSIDLGDALRAGDMKLVGEPAEGHYYVDKDGKQWRPELPYMEGDQ